MPALQVQVTRFIDPDPQPGISECKFTDAHGTEWFLIDKYVYMSARYLHAGLRYPRPGSLECWALSRRHDERGNEIVLVRLDEVRRSGDPDGEEQSQVEVFAHQLLPFRQLQVQVTGIVEQSDFPLYACEFADARGRVWKFVDNKWIMRPPRVLRTTGLPTFGQLHCLEVSRRRDDQGREVVLIDTERPLGAEDIRLPEPPEDARTRFEVFAELLSDVPDRPLPGEA